ncbi:MAG: hypothetical protein ABI629_07925 [bacterium]
MTPSAAPVARQFSNYARRHVPATAPAELRLGLWCGSEDPACPRIVVTAPTLIELDALERAYRCPTCRRRDRHIGWLVETRARRAGTR